MPSTECPSLVLGRAYRPDRTAVLACGDTTSPMAADNGLCCHAAALTGLPLSSHEHQQKATLGLWQPNAICPYFLNSR
jgi:hypothetical protein